MSGVVSLQHKPNDEVVLILREALEEAERGELQAVVMVADHTDPNSCGRVWRSSMTVAQTLKAIGQLTVEVADLSQAVNEGME